MRDATNDPDTGALVDDGTTPVTATVQSATINCTPNAAPTHAECVGTFTFSPNYQPASDATTLNLDTGKKIVVGNTTTPYFELTTITGGIPVSPGTTYASLQITWQITVS